MYQKRPKFYKKPPIISELKKITNESKDLDWMLFHYGRSYMHPSQKRLHKECYFKNVSKKSSYYIGNWNHEDRLIKLSIPETSTYYYQLGSKFNSKGRYISAPKTNIKERIYPINNVRISSLEDYKDTGFHSLIKDTSYPLWKGDKEEKIYNKCPYYYKDIIRNGVVKRVIIPIHVIISYFFYLSPMCIYDILYRNFHNGLKDPDFTPEVPVLPYRSNVIREREVRSLGKYAFTPNRRFSIRCIKYIWDEFMKKSLNSEKNKREEKHYLTTRVPFDFDSFFDMSGIYIEDKQKGEPQKFLVFRINKTRPLTGNKFWKYKNFKILDLRDTRSTQGRDAKEEQLYTSIVPDYSSFNGEHGEEETNSNIKTQDFNVGNSSNHFFESPIIDKIKKTNQKFKYIVDNVIIKPIRGLGDNYENQYSGSDLQKYNELNNTSIDDFFKITIAAMKILGEKGFVIKTLKLDQADSNEIYSYSPIYSDFNDKILMFQISEDNYNYCLIDVGWGRKMGLFRYINHEMEFLEYSDPKLRKMIYDLALVENFNFTNIRKTNKYSGIKMLEPCNHLHIKLKGKTQDEKAENLAKRIEKKINKDI